MAEKYDLITLFKWLFLIGLIFNFPLGINQFLNVDWSTLPIKEAVLPMIFVVFMYNCDDLLSKWICFKLN